MSLGSTSEDKMEAMATELSQLGTEKLQVFNGILKDIGMQGDMLDEWLNTFRDNITDTYEMLINDAERIRSKLINSIEKYLQEASRLCKELRIELPPFGAQNLGLLEEIKILEEEVQKFKTIAETRRKQIERLLRSEAHLCKYLGVTPRIPSDGQLPTEEEVQQYQKIIDDLESEKFSRDEIFLTKKCEIMELVKDINFKPTLDFEKLVLHEEDNLFPVTDENLKKLNKFSEYVKNLHKDVISDIKDIQEDIRSLWEILDEDLTKYDSFIQGIPGTSMDKLLALRIEKERCQNIKRANIEKFVIKLRQELTELWDKCRFAPEERLAFRYFHCDIFTEDLLSHHDLEIEKLKRYYNENRTFFELVIKREELWQKLHELEERANTKDRYKNRGGELLKEEKQRNVISKQIPKIEQQLQELADKYQEHYGKPLFVDGEPVEAIICRDYRHRDAEKKMKLSARKQQKEMALTPASSAVNLARTPMSSKRKLGFTSTMTPKYARTIEKSTFGGLGNGPSVSTKDLRPPTIRNLRTISHKKNRSSLEKRKIVRKYQRLSQNSNKENSTILDYSLFQDNLTARKDIRSTLFGGEDQFTAVATPLTPSRKYAPNTPNKTPRTGRATPQRGNKLTVASSSKLLF